MIWFQNQIKKHIDFRMTDARPWWKQVIAGVLHTPLVLFKIAVVCGITTIIGAMCYGIYIEGYLPIICYAIVAVILLVLFVLCREWANKIP